MLLTKEQLESTVSLIRQKLTGENYAVRGTASLVLQGLDMHVADIDILCDATTALNANIALAEYLVEKVAYRESPNFKSYFGKFTIQEVTVEIMGDWQIFSAKKGWSKVYSADATTITHVTLADVVIPVTRVDLELEVFALMGRWTAYQKIKRLVREQAVSQPKLF
jgi:hypothetical protein